MDLEVVHNHPKYPYRLDLALSLSFHVAVVIVLLPWHVVFGMLPDCFLPTNRGATMWGNTTMSLKGKTGNSLFIILYK